MNRLIKDKLQSFPFLQDAYYLFKRAKYRALKRLGAEEIFTRYYKSNFWNDSESVSGSGSNRTNTAKLVTELRPMLDKLQVGCVLDIPCGDFQWMRHVSLDGINYVGGDVVQRIVEQLEVDFGSPQVTFRHLDLLQGDLPQMDLAICRDCLVHFSFADIRRALAGIQRSGAKYLATTHFPSARRNHEIVTGDWRRLNFNAAPFNWPPAEEAIHEQSCEGGGRYADKTLSFWRVETLPL